MRWLQYVTPTWLSFMNFTNDLPVNNDDYLSRLRLLKFGREEVLHNLGNVRSNTQNPYWYI